MLLNFSYAEIKDLCHGETFRRANCGAESAKTALTHVDIEAGSINAFRGAVRGLSEFLDSPDRLYVYAINRTDLGTFVTHDAIVNFIVQSVSPIVGNRYHLVRILNGGNSFRMKKVLRIRDGYDDTLSGRSPEMAQRDHQPLGKGAEGCKQIIEI